MEAKKRKVGRPRTRELPMVNYGMRIPVELKVFLQEQEHTNDFIRNTLLNTPEFKAYIAHKQQETLKQETSLF